MSGNIIGVEWRSAGRSVCFVAVDYENYWQAYVTAPGPIPLALGMGATEPPELTETYCAEHGAKLSWQEAKAFFPQFDITRYKTFPQEIKS